MRWVTKAICLALRVADLIPAAEATRAQCAALIGFAAGLRKNDLKLLFKVCELFPVPAESAKAPDDDFSNEEPADSAGKAQSQGLRSKDVLLGYLARQQARACQFDNALQTLRRITSE